MGAGTAMMLAMLGFAGIGGLEKLIKTYFGHGISKEQLELQKKQMLSQTEGLKMAFKHKTKSADKMFQQMMAIRSRDRQNAIQAQQSAMVLQMLQNLMGASRSMRQQPTSSVNPAIAAGLIR